MILSKEELMNIVRDRITGEDDDTLAILENVSDTINDYEARLTNPDTEDWKTRFEENDKMWRQKYRDRFFNSNVEETVVDVPDGNAVEEEETEPTTFDDLFTVTE